MLRRMASIEERVASLVLNRFHALPARSKPRIFPDGRREWIPLSGVVLARGMMIVLRSFRVRSD